MKSKETLEEKFRKLALKAELDLRTKWHMLESSKLEFENRVNKEMARILKEVRKNRTELKGLQKDLKATVNYFDTQDIKIKNYVGYKNQL
jgi:hypothetical protein